MTYEKSRSVWASGFRGYKNRVTGKLTAVNWEELAKGIQAKKKNGKL